LRRRRRANMGAIIGAIVVLIGIAALAIVLAMASRPARGGGDSPYKPMNLGGSSVDAPKPRAIEGSERATIAWKWYTLF
jgi:hypothetical protein